MKSIFHPQTAGVLGIAGALLFFAGLVIEYHYGLFPPGQGMAFVLNQLQFYLAMSGILAMLWGMRAVRAGGDGRFGLISLTAFAVGWGVLVVGGLIGLLTGNFDNVLIPLGALTAVLFGLLAGIAVVTAGKWTGWARFAPLLQGVYNLAVMMILPPTLTGSNEPTFVTESTWMATWFLMGLALYQQAGEKQKVNPTGEIQLVQ